MSGPIQGTLDAKTKTIRVDSIDPLGPSPSRRAVTGSLARKPTAG